MQDAVRAGPATQPARRTPSWPRPSIHNWRLRGEADTRHGVLRGPGARQRESARRTASAARRRSYGVKLGGHPQAPSRIGTIASSRSHLGTGTRGDCSRRCSRPRDSVAHDLDRCAIGRQPRSPMLKLRRQGHREERSPVVGTTSNWPPRGGPSLGPDRRDRRARLTALATARARDAERADGAQGMNCARGHRIQNLPSRARPRHRGDISDLTRLPGVEGCTSPFARFDRQMCPQG